MNKLTKNLIAVILAVLMIFSIMGCSGSGFSPTFSDKAPTAEENF